MSFLDFKNKKYLYLIPAGVIAVVLTLVFFDLHKDPFPQAGQRTGTLMPSLNLPLLENPDQAGLSLTAQDFKGHFTIVNFFASWCKYCRREHETLRELAQFQKTHGFHLYGVNVHDTRHASTLWLGEVGNPYEKIGFDGKGDAARTWGVLGTPSLFVIDPAGKIVYQYSGVLTAEHVHDQILPLLPTRPHASAP